MSNYKVSIIIPVYNSEKYLSDCLDSIINQTYKNLEIIIVDDGSTDNSGFICDKYSKKEKRIKVIHKNNGGLSDARNFGIENATGEYITFVDSDDIIQLNMIEEMINVTNDSFNDIVICSFERFFNKFVFDNSKSVIKYEKKEYFYNILKFKMSTYACGVLIPTLFLKNIKFIKNRYFEDLAIMYKIYDKCDAIYYINSKLYKYRMNPNSIVHTLNCKKASDYLLSTNEMLNYIKNNFNFDEKDINTFLYNAYREAYVMSKDNNYLKDAKKVRKNINIKGCSIKVKIKLLLLNNIFLTKLLIKIKNK